MYLSSGDLQGSLLRCFQLMAGVVKGKSGESFGGSKVNERLACQMNMALASEVLSFIDSELPAPVSSFYRWVYGHDQSASECYYLARYCWGEVDEMLEGRRISVRDNLSGIRLMAAFEVRHRVLNGGRSCYTREVLSNAIGVDLSRYKRGYAKVWGAMVDSLLDLGEACKKELEEYIDWRVGEELEVASTLGSVDVEAFKAQAKARRKDYSGEIDSSSFSRVRHVGASAMMDAAAGQEDVEAYLDRGGVVNVVGEKKFKKAC